MAKRKDYQLAETKTFAVEKNSYELLLKSMGVSSGEAILAKEKLMAIDPTTKAILVKWIDAIPAMTGTQIVTLLEALIGDNRLKAEAIRIIDIGDHYTSTTVEGALQEVGSFHENSMILSYMALFNG